MNSEKFNFLAEQIKQLHQIVLNLNRKFTKKQFTLDGRLVGDIGEVIAEIVYDLELYEKLKKHYDAQTPDDKSVQIKATFKESLTFTHNPDYYLGIKLYEDGTFEEVYNGTGKLIFEKYKHRKGIGEKLLSFPIHDLKLLNEKVNDEDRIPKRSVE